MNVNHVSATKHTIQDGFININKNIIVKNPTTLLTQAQPGIVLYIHMYVCIMYIYY